jgi:methyl-accepting chemotaxis protein
MSFLRLIGKLNVLSRSVFLRCVVLLAVSTGIVATSLGVMSLLTANHTAKRSIQREAVEVTQLVADQSGGGVMFDKVENVAAILDAVVARGDGAVLGAYVVNTKGEVVASAGNDDVRTELEAHVEQAATGGDVIISDDGFVVAAPVRFGKDNAVVGALGIEWTPTPLLAEIRAEQFRAIAVALALLATTLLAAGWVTRRTVTRPLLAVDEAMGRVAAGDFGAEVPCVGRRDEIGSIASTLESFRGTLVEAEKLRREAVFKGAGFESSSVPMMLADSSFEIVYVNNAFTDQAERLQEHLRAVDPSFAATRLVGRRLGSLNELPKGFEAEIADAARLPYRTEVGLGESRIAIEINAVREAKGTVIGYVVEWNDVTRIRRNGAILSALDANQIWIDTTAEGEIVGVNKNFCKLLAADSAAVLGCASDDVLRVDGDEAAERARLAEAMSEGRSYFGRFHISLGDVRAVVEGSVTPILDARGNIVRHVIIANDITGAHRALEAVEADRQMAAAAQARVVEALGAALEQLSGGDMSVAIEAEFAPEYERLRQDFNRAMAKLLEAMRAVVDTSGAITGEVQGITQASAELSSRTENQAATLEETAASLDELTASVKFSAERASQAAQVVSEARESAEDSGTVVREAVSAMGEIEASSDQISKIIGVIDDIAFQTNLLALNAGVEAARAGDAGRGFAVVASEVRALAQRSSDAAREINGLISSSGTQVKRGVDLVGQAGKALDRIVASIADIAGHVGEIASSSSEQSQGLAEINQAMTQLDQVTQQNAAMFEETSAASQSLARAASALSETVGRFRTGSDRAVVAFRHAAFATAPSLDATAAVSSTADVDRRLKQTVNAERVTDDDGWAEF